MALLASLSNMLDSKQQKDIQVPPEILTVVENLKKHLAEQKKIRDEITQTSNKPLDDLSNELQELQKSVSCILSGLRRQNVKSSHLSEEILKMERNVGMIQRSLDASSDFTQINPEINAYFKNALSSFSGRVQTYKQEVKAVENSLSSGSNATLTPKELSDVLQKLDGTFMSLAAQLYTLTEELKVPKSQLLRQHYSFDSNKIIDSPAPSKSPFDKILFESEKKSANTPYGPSPFTTVAVTTNQQAAVSNTGLSLGVTSQPTSTTTTTSASGFSFSALKPATSTASPFSLGLGTSTTSASSTAGFSLGGLGAAKTTATTTSSTGFSFGLSASAANKTSTSSTGFGFGAPSTAQPAQSTTGFGFGTQSTTQPAQSTPSFGFGAQPSTQASSGFSFGTQPAQSTTGFGFGAQAATQPAQSTTGFGFGTPTTTATGFSTLSSGTTGGSIFGSPAAAKPSLFGAK